MYKVLKLKKLRMQKKLLMRTPYYDKKDLWNVPLRSFEKHFGHYAWYKQCRAIPWNFLSDQSDSYHTFWGVRNGLFNLHTIDLQEGRGGAWLTAWWWVEVMNLFSQRDIKQKHGLVVVKLSHFYGRPFFCCVNWKVRLAFCKNDVWHSYWTAFFALLNDIFCNFWTLFHR